MADRTRSKTSDGGAKAQSEDLKGLMDKQTDSSKTLIEKQSETLTKCLTDVLNKMSLQSNTPKGNPSTSSGRFNQPGGYPNFESSFVPSNHPGQMKFPKFSGNDPIGWIYKAEQYFFCNEIDVNRWVTMASYNMEDEALQYFRWLDKARGRISWKDLTTALLQRFGPPIFQDPAGALTKLRQTGTVEEYQKEFERLSSLVNGLSEEFLVSCFLSGLRDDIQSSVRMFNPQDLITVFGLARLQEEQLTVVKQLPKSSAFTTFKPTSNLSTFTTTVSTSCSSFTTRVTRICSTAISSTGATNYSSRHEGQEGKRPLLSLR